MGWCGGARGVRGLAGAEPTDAKEKVPTLTAWAWLTLVAAPAAGTARSTPAAMRTTDVAKYLASRIRHPPFVVGGDAISHPLPGGLVHRFRSGVERYTITGRAVRSGARADHRRSAGVVLKIR
jgi:hypothetical protein